jgi:hypothetical protein
MSKHITISPAEAADRLAIRELVEAYAHCADRRDAKGQMSLFTADTHFVVYMNAKDPTPSQELHSREALAPVFAELNKYDATTHFIGQSTIFALTGDRATGETYCLAHHVTVDAGGRRLILAVCAIPDRVRRRSRRDGKCRGGQTGQSRERSFPHGGPRVRIHLPPAGSPVRTGLGTNPLTFRTVVSGSRQHWHRRTMLSTLWFRLCRLRVCRGGDVVPMTPEMRPGLLTLR